MNTPIERLQTALETLGLKAVEARLENLLEQASKKEPSYADFLEELLSCEVEARRGRYLRARLQLAHLPFVKTFEQFDFSFQPSIDERQIRELCSLRFIHEASNVIFLGPPGVGKTHLSVALAAAAIQSGFAAYFITAHDLATDLGKAYREGRLDRRMRIYLAPKVLGLGLRFAQNAPKDGAGLRSVRGQGSAFLRFRGGEFSTGTMGNFQPVLTVTPRRSLRE